HGWPLAITLPCGVRTFLALPGANRESRDCLACFARAQCTIAPRLIAPAGCGTKSLSVNLLAFDESAHPID
ncbi:MAG: hypothetical protein ACTHKH_23215, partial [Trinickia sp.]